MDSISQPVSFTVPYLTPPSVNHYKEPCVIRVRGGGTRNSYRVTAEAKAYKDAVAMFARGESLIPLQPAGMTHQAYSRMLRKILYGVQIGIYLGSGKRLDADNGNKVVLDALQHCRVIHSDAYVHEVKSNVFKDDRENPRTEIKVWRIQ